MLRDYDDDDVVTWGWPWHGLVDTVEGLHHPNKPLAYSVVRGGVSTTLFDIGRGPVETPAEVAAQGGELWSKAILRWNRTLTAINNGSIEAPGFWLPGVPIVQQREGVPEVVVFTRATLRVGESVEFRGQHQLPTGISWAFGQIWSREDAGQGAGQPDVDVFGWGVAGAGMYLRPLGATGRLEGILLDFRDNRLLYGLTADYPRAPSGSIWVPGVNERPTLLLGLVEIEIDIQNGTGVQLRVIEDRAAALGRFERHDSGSVWNGPRLQWHPWTTESDTLDGVSCTGSVTYTTPGGWGSDIQDGINTIWFDRRDDTNSRHSIVGGLLLARYGADGDVETARYDAEYVLVRDIEHKHENSGTDRLRWVHQMAGKGCDLVSATELYSSVTWSRRELSELTVRQAIYGFDGALVDEESFHGVARFEQVRLYSRQNTYSSVVLSEVPGSRVITINGIERSLEWDANPFAQNHFNASPGARGAGLLAGRVVSRNGEYDWSSPSIWLLSNNMACIARHDPATRYLRAGPAVTPSGPDLASYPSEHDFSSVARVSAAMTFLSGSWNPVTGEVARCGVDRRFSWA